MINLAPVPVGLWWTSGSYEEGRKRGAVSLDVKFWKVRSPITLWRHILSPVFWRMFDWLVGHQINLKGMKSKLDKEWPKTNSEPAIDNRGPEQSLVIISLALSFEIAQWIEKQMRLKEYRSLDLPDMICWFFEKRKQKNQIFSRGKAPRIKLQLVWNFFSFPEITQNKQPSRDFGDFSWLPRKFWTVSVDSYCLTKYGSRFSQALASPKSWLDSFSKRSVRSSIFFQTQLEKFWRNILFIWNDSKKFDEKAFLSTPYLWSEQHFLVVFAQKVG